MSPVVIHGGRRLEAAEGVTAHASLLEHRTAAEAVANSRAVHVLDVVPKVNCLDGLHVLVVFVIDKQLLHAFLL